MNHSIELYMEDGMAVSIRYEHTWAEMLPWMMMYCPGYIHMHVRQRKDVTRVFLYN